MLLCIGFLASCTLWPIWYHKCSIGLKSSEIAGQHKTFMLLSRNSDFVLLSTVTSEIFGRVVFSRSFMKIKSSPNGKITLSFTYEGKSCHSCKFLCRKYVFYSYSGK